MKTYESPALDLIRFDAEDVLTTSFATWEEFMDACNGVTEVTGQEGYEQCPEVYICPNLTA